MKFAHLPVACRASTRAEGYPNCETWGDDDDELLFISRFRLWPYRDALRTTRYVVGLGLRCDYDTSPNIEVS